METKLYRCTDCNTPFHRHCARNHFKRSESASPPPKVHSRTSNGVIGGDGFLPTDIMKITSTTPLTDNEIVTNAKKYSGSLVRAEFAGKLERQLTAAKTDANNALIDMLESLSIEVLNKQGKFLGTSWDSGAGSNGYDQACRDIATILKSKALLKRQINPTNDHVNQENKQ